MNDLNLAAHLRQLADARSRRGNAHIAQRLRELADEIDLSGAECVTAEA